MILNIEFKNFRSFKDNCVFTTEPYGSQAKTDNIFITENPDDEKKALNISMIYGANASGKSNIIKFLNLLRRWVLNIDTRIDKDIEMYQPFKFDTAAAEQPSCFLIEFVTRENIRYIYEVEFSRREILKESLCSYPMGRKRMLYERRVLKDSDMKDGIILGSSISGIKNFYVFKSQLILSSFLSQIPCEPITEAARYFDNLVISYGYHEDKISGRDEDLKRWLYEDENNLLRLSKFISYSDTGMNSVKVTKLNGYMDVSAIHTLFADGEEKDITGMPIKEESFGTRSLLFIGCYMLQALDRGVPFIADEMDSGLHTYIKRLIVDIFRNKRINRNNAQLIFTTHDINLLDESIIRKDQVWFTEKNSKGESSLFSLSDFEDVREDTPFDKWYMNKKFGGVPSLESLENLF